MDLLFIWNGLQNGQFQFFGVKESGPAIDMVMNVAEKRGFSWIDTSLADIVGELHRQDEDANYDKDKVLLDG